MSGAEVTGRTTSFAWDVLARAAAAQHGAADEQLLHEFLAFELGRTPLAIPVERVREIVRLRPITSMPRVPAEIRGVISLRGEIVQVLDLRLRLGLPAVTPTRATRIIVLHGAEGQMTGVLVDSVAEVLRVREDALRLPAGGESEMVGGLCKRGEQFVSLLEVDRVLDLGGS